MDPIDRIIGAESGGNPYARNSRSSAYGAGQFINSTWLDMMRRHRPDLMQGRTEADVLALRSDPTLSRDMTGLYANQNAEALRRANLPVTAATTYLAHFAGPRGAVGVLSADPSTPVGAVLGDAAVRANPFMANMTVADLQAWAGRKMGDAGAPAAQPQAAPASYGALTPPVMEEPAPASARPQAQPNPMLRMALGALNQRHEEPPPVPLLLPPAVRRPAPWRMT